MAVPWHSSPVNSSTPTHLSPSLNWGLTSLATATGPGPGLDLILKWGLDRCTGLRIATRTDIGTVRVEFECHLLNVVSISWKRETGEKGRIESVTKCDLHLVTTRLTRLELELAVSTRKWAWPNFRAKDFKGISSLIGRERP